MLLRWRIRSLTHADGKRVSLDKNWILFWSERISWLFYFALECSPPHIDLWWTSPRRNSLISSRFLSAMQHTDFVKDEEAVYSHFFYVLQSCMHEVTGNSTACTAVSRSQLKRGVAACRRGIVRPTSTTSGKRLSQLGIPIRWISAFSVFRHAFNLHRDFGLLHLPAAAGSRWGIF